MSGIRHYNYKDNVRIPENRVLIRTFEIEGEVVFRVEELDIPEPRQGSLNAAEFANGRVVLSARDKSADVNFSLDLGSVAEIMSGKKVGDQKMPGFRDVSSVLFNLRVLNGDKMVMAHLEAFPADNDRPDNRLQLFKTRTDNLGEVPYLVEWDDDIPTIVIDEQFYVAFDGTAMMNALIVAPALTTIIPRIVALIEDDPENEFYLRVIGFGEDLAGTLSTDSVDTWMDTVIANLSRKHSIKTRLIEAYGKKDGNND